MIDLETCKLHPLARVSDWYSAGLVSRVTAEAYVKLWNDGPHFTTATVMDGAIRNV